MRLAFAALALALVWTLSAGSFAWGDLALGLVLSIAVLKLTGPTHLPPLGPRFLVRCVPFAAFYVSDLLRSGLRVARQCLQPVGKLQPMIVEIPIESRTDFEVALLTNLINYSPGTLCLEVADDGRTLLVHALSVDDEQELTRFVREDLERRVSELLR